MLGNKYSVNPTTQATTELIAQLKTQAETYEHQITNEQQNHAKLQARDAELKETILELKQQMGGVNNSLEKSIRVRANIYYRTTKRRPIWLFYDII